MEYDLIESEILIILKAKYSTGFGAENMFHIPHTVDKHGRQLWYMDMCRTGTGFTCETMLAYSYWEVKKIQVYFHYLFHCTDLWHFAIRIDLDRLGGNARAAGLPSQWNRRCL